jgi:hypothetical protein
MPDRPVPADHEQVKQITAWGVAIMSGIWGTPDQRPAAEDALDALVAALAAAEKERDEAREELRENDRIVERAWRDRDAETERAVTAETALREAEEQRNQYATELHSLRWVLGLETHEDEDQQDEETSVANLRALLARAAVPTEEKLTVWWWPVGHGLGDHDVAVPYEIVLPAAEALDFAAKLPDARPMEWVKVFCQTERDIRWRWTAAVPAETDAVRPEVHDPET